VLYYRIIEYSQFLKLLDFEIKSNPRNRLSIKMLFDGQVVNSGLGEIYTDILFLPK
jgi:hypothetical protein